MTTTTPEPGDVLARNDVTRPTFTDLASGDQAVGWLRGSGTLIIRVGGSDRSGNPVPAGAIYAEKSTSYYACTSLGTLAAGDELAVWTHHTTLYGATASVDITTDRAAPSPSTSGPTCAKLPATSPDPIVPVTLTVPADGDYWLRVNAVGGTISSVMYLFGVRVAPAGDDYGIFSGATLDTEDVAYDWEGEPFASPSLAAVPGPPEPPPAPSLAGYVARLLGTPDDVQVLAQAEQASEVVTAMAREYTRGRGFTVDGYTEGIRAVIVTATARLMGNPEQVDHGLGSDWTRGSFSGWTLAEQYVLNGYRRRAQ